MLRMLIVTTTLSLLACGAARAQSSPRLFVGAAAGISTLSADAQSEITSARVDVSLYKPENGPAVNIFLGVHLHDYVTVQANYIWNRNDVALASVRASDTGPVFYEQPRTAFQHALVGDLLAYFRDRHSAVRPYLSVGLGVVRLDTNEAGQSQVRGATLPPTRIQATHPLLRVAVGIDVAVGSWWRARYSFSESVSGNPISAQLSPPGQRNLANFQNLFGLVRAF